MWKLTLLTLIFCCQVLTPAQSLNKNNGRIILVGPDEQGKNSAGNIILGKEVFQKDARNSNACQCEEGEGENGERISLIITPGFKEEKDMINCVVVHSFPGPHAFLLVINVKKRNTSDEIAAVKWIENNFGWDAFMYTILLFTHTDQLQGKTLDEYIRESAHLRKLRDIFKGRYHAFNSQLKDRTPVRELLQIIEDMVQQNGGTHFTHDLYKQEQKEIQEQLDYILALAPYFPRGLGSDTDRVSETDKQKCREYLKKKLHYIFDLLYWFLSLFMPKWMPDAMFEITEFSKHCGFPCLEEILKDYMKQRKEQ